MMKLTATLGGIVFVGQAALRAGLDLNSVGSSAESSVVIVL